MAITRTETLYRVEVVVRKLRNEPRRILEVRRHLHLGMAVHFMTDHDAAMHSGRIIAMHERVLTIDEFEPRLRWSGVPCAAIDLGATDEGDNFDILDTPSPPRQNYPRSHSREDFRIGDTVSFIDRNQNAQFGRIERLNRKTVSLQCDSGAWRVPYGLLQPVVDL
jgi:hypothetical protein